MTNRTMHLSLAELAQMSDDAWVWKDDMITFLTDLEDDEADLYDDGSADRILAELDAEGDHPICGEFPHDSVVAPRGWDKID